MAERRVHRSGTSRLSPLLPLALLWGAGATLLVGLISQNQVSYDQLLLDPNSVNGVPWYTGLVSNLGVLGWTTATSVGFVGAWIADVGDRPGAVSMLRGGALLSAILLLDDLFQIHILVKPLLGVPKAGVYAAYLLLTGWWAISQLQEIRRTRALLLSAAGFAFFLSVVVDQTGTKLFGLADSTALLAEDAAKFLGVLAWAQYFVLTSTDVVRSILDELRSQIDRTTETPSPETASPENVSPESGVAPTAQSRSSARARA